MKLNNLELTEIKTIYVVCPAKVKTGGPELLHQLVYTLNNLGKNAILVYTGIENKTYQINDEYCKYVRNYILPEEVEDNEKNLIITSEVKIQILKLYKNIKKCIWWLSVDNFFILNFSFESIKYRFWDNTLLFKITDPIRILKCKIEGTLNFLSMHNKIFKSVDLNMCQSFYAINFCKKNNLRNVIYLSDYINTDFVKNDVNKEKDDIVLYNPKKGKNFTRKLIITCPKIKFVPIQNMTRTQVMEIQKRAKIYIDFGNFPGKDRLPREAVLCGCIVITGRNGASQYYEDVPLPDEYKFDTKKYDISNILTKIEDSLSDYYSNYENMQIFKNSILSEKEKFESDVRNIFIG